MTTHDDPWKPLQKFGFRFVFLFFSIISIQCVQLVVWIAVFAFRKDGFDLAGLYKPIVAPIHWLDRHIFHIGYDPALHSNSPGDGRFGSAFYLTAILISILAAIIWGLLDKKRSNYDRLYYWFCLYLRYVLGITIITYGIDKVIPVQMTHPSLPMLTEPFGNTSRFNVLWNFMGMSPGYMIFTGSFEVIGGLMLFFRRTVVASCILLTFILSNVVALNWFYNIGVKMFSMQLLLFTLYLLLPYIKTLFGFLFNNGSAPLYSPKQFAFQTKWKKGVLIAALLMVSSILILLNGVSDYKRYVEVTANERIQKAYDVTTFIAKDTIPPLTTDTLRWKRVLLYVYGQYFIVYNMQDKSKWYKFAADSTHKTFTLQKGTDKSKWQVLHYTNPAKDQMQLSGKWKGKDISVSLKLSPVDSIPLNKEKVTFFEED